MAQGANARVTAQKLGAPTRYQQHGEAPGLWVWGDGSAVEATQPPELRDTVGGRQVRSLDDGRTWQVMSDKGAQWEGEGLAAAVAVGMVALAAWLLFHNKGRR